MKKYSTRVYVATNLVERYTEVKYTKTNKKGVEDSDECLQSVLMNRSNQIRYIW